MHATDGNYSVRRFIGTKRGSIELGGTRNSVDSTAERNGNLAGKVIQNSLCTRNTISAASGDCNAHSNARREAVRHARVGWACVRDGQGVSSFLPRSYFLFFSTCTPHARPFPPEKGAPPVLRHTQVFLSERRGGHTPATLYTGNWIVAEKVSLSS